MISKDQTPDIGKDTQWQKGESGNPAGKPKGALHLSTRIQNLLNDPEFEQKMKDGTIVKGEPMAIVIKAMVAKAISGNVQCAEWLAKHGYGLKQVHSFEEPPVALVEFIDNASNQSQDTIS